MSFVNKLGDKIRKALGRSGPRGVGEVVVRESDFDSLFESVFGDGGSGSKAWVRQWRVPSVDVQQNRRAVVIRAELPALDAADLDVSVTEHAVVLRGEKRHKRRTKEGRFFRRERSYCSFHRVVPLPSGMDTGRAEAYYKGGVLTVTIPRVRLQSIRQIRIAA